MGHSILRRNLPFPSGLRDYAITRTSELTYLGATFLRSYRAYKLRIFVHLYGKSITSSCSREVILLLYAEDSMNFIIRVTGAQTLNCLLAIVRGENFISKNYTIIIAEEHIDIMEKNYYVIKFKIYIVHVRNGR